MQLLCAILVSDFCFVDFNWCKPARDCTCCFFRYPLDVIVFWNGFGWAGAGAECVRARAHLRLFHVLEVIYSIHMTLKKSC